MLLFPSTSMSSAAEKPESWLVNTKRQYKIWFSGDPNTFLGIENELRFIRAREKNPDAQFNFVFSAKCLSEEALRKLHSFCGRHHIIPVDFDSELSPQLEHELDKKLYEMAHLEIDKKRLNQGGNMAAASDCARLIVPLIEKSGIYSDFDVEINFSEQPQFVEVKAPIVLPSFTHFGMGLNSDFLMLSVDRENPLKLSPDAIDKVRLVQAFTLNNYANPKEALLNDEFMPGISVGGLSRIQKAIICDYFHKNPDADIFSFRSFLCTMSIFDVFDALPYKKSIFHVESREGLSESELLNEMNFGRITHLPGKVENEVRLLKHSLEIRSVTQISGPKRNYIELIKEAFPPKGFRVTSDFLGEIIEPLHHHLQVLTLLANMGVDVNGFSGCYRSKNSFDGFLGSNISMTSTENMIDAIGKLCDTSWSMEGEKKKAQREVTISNAAQTIQNAWKTYKSSTPLLALRNVNESASSSSSTDILDNTTHPSKRAKPPGGIEVAMA